MSKGLEALLNPYGFCLPCVEGQECEYTYIERQKRIIEKELKALEIIKCKQVNVYSFIQRKPKTFEEYQDIDDEIEQLSEASLSMEEYDLLKEVLL